MDFIGLNYAPMIYEQVRQDDELGTKIPLFCRLNLAIYVLQSAGNYNHALNPSIERFNAKANQGGPFIERINTALKTLKCVQACFQLAVTNKVPSPALPKPYTESPLLQQGLDLSKKAVRFVQTLHQAYSEAAQKVAELRQRQVPRHVAVVQHLPGGAAAAAAGPEAAPLPGAAAHPRVLKHPLGLPSAASQGVNKGLHAALSCPSLNADLRHKLQEAVDEVSMIADQHITMKEKLTAFKAALRSIHQILYKLQNEAKENPALKESYNQIRQGLIDIAKLNQELVKSIKVCV